MLGVDHPLNQRSKPNSPHGRVPVITGEVHYRGMHHVDGVLSGQMGAGGGSLAIRQSPRPIAREPELSGEIRFRDMVRVNGHVAGTIYSQKGTLIVDTNARVEAKVDVAVALIAGTVHGDIIARERVEVGPAAKVYGNICTRSIEVKNGAIFEGCCRMFEEESVC